MRKVIGMIRSASVNCRVRDDNTAEIAGLTVRGELLDPKDEFSTRFQLTLNLDEMWRVVEAAGARFLPGEIVGKHIIMRYEEKDGVGSKALEFVGPMYS